jgi:hypothetical protein
MTKEKEEHTCMHMPQHKPTQENYGEKLGINELCMNRGARRSSSLEALSNRLAPLEHAHPVLVLIPAPAAHRELFIVR